MVVASLVEATGGAGCNDECDELDDIESVDAARVLTVNLLLPFLVDVVVSLVDDMLLEEVESLCTSGRLEVEVASLTMKRVAFFDGE